MYPKKVPNRYNYKLHGSSIPVMLKSTKKVLTVRQYKALRRLVNRTAGYANQKGLIYASVQAKKQKLREEDI